MNKSWNASILLAAFVFGLLFSIRWIAPAVSLYHERKLEYFHPFHYRRVSETDDYFYYAKVRDAMDGLFLAKDPVSLEQRNKFTPHTAYMGSFWLAAWSGIFQRSSIFAYCANFFVFPFLTFFLIANILRYYMSSRSLTILAAFIVAVAGMFWLPVELFYTLPAKLFVLPKLLLAPWSSYDFSNMTQLARMPNTMVFAPVLCFLFFCISTLERHVDDRRKFRRWQLWSAIALLISVVTSVTTLMTAVIFVGLLCFCHPIGLVRRSCVRMGLLVAPAILFMMYQSAVGLSNTEPWNSMGTSIPTNPKAFNALFWTEVFFLVLPAAWMWFQKGKSRLLPASFWVSVCVCYGLLFAREGIFYAERVVSRGAETPMAACFVAFFADWIRNKYPTFRWERFRAPSVVLFVWLSVMFGLNQFAIARKSIPLSIAPVRPLCDWLVSHTTPQDVLVTVDPDLLVNLPSCQPASLYVPQAMMSFTDPSERYSRMAQAWAFYGGRADDLMDWLRHPANITDPWRDYEWMLSSHLKLVLFYARFHRDRQLPEGAIAPIRQAFARSNTLAYQHHVFVIGPVEEALFERNRVSSAEYDRKFQKIGQAGPYRIYRFAS